MPAVLRSKRLWSLAARALSSCIGVVGALGRDGFGEAYGVDGVWARGRGCGFHVVLSVQ
jgi:hypothetical protein